MPQIRSRTNGLIINIPADAAGVIGRFATAGGNDLIFDKASLGMKNGKRPAPDSTPMTVRSLAPDPGSPDAQAQARAQADADALS